MIFAEHGSVTPDLQQAIGSLKGVLDHPFIPNRIGHRVRPILEVARIVTDEEFDQLALAHSDCPFPMAQQLILAKNQGGEGAYMYPRGDKPGRNSNKKKYC